MTNKLPQGWVECEFGKIFEVVNGDRGKNYPAKNKLQTTGIPFVSAVNIQDGKLREDNLLCLTDEQYNLLNNGKINTEDTLLCIRGSIGKHCRYFKEKGAIASSMVIIRRNQFEVLNSLLHYYLDSHIMKAEIKKYDNGTAQPNLSAADLRKFYFPLPPLNEQKRIVKKIEEEFGKIDEGVEKLKLAQEQIKQYRQSVLKAAFEGKLYKTTEWEETELEKIITNSQIGLVRSNAEQSDVCLKEMVPYIKMNNITNDGKYDINKIVYVNASKEEIDKYKLKIGDILFNTRNSYELVGKTTIVNKLNSEKTIYNNNIMRLRFIKNIVPEFMNYQMNAIKFKKYITRAKKATTNICALYSKDLFPSPVNVPTLDEQKQIVKEIEKRFEVTDEAERVITENLEKAEQLKQSILKKAFEGRLVPQDPTDQPASILLQKIKAEREN